MPGISLFLIDTKITHRIFSQRAMAPKKLSLGKDAVGSCLLKYLHPSHVIREHFDNRKTNQRLSELKVVGQEMRLVNRRQQMVVVTTHHSLNRDRAPIKVYCAKRWFKVDVEGPKELFFGYYQETIQEEKEEEREMVPEIVERYQNLSRFATHQVLDLKGVMDIDDDNDPAPENIPTNTEPSTNTVFNEWGDNGVCQRKAVGAINVGATVKNMLRDAKPSALSLFEHFFPKEFVLETLLPATNENLNISLQYGEFLRFVGVILIMSTTHYGGRSDLWSQQPISPFEGVSFRLNEIMSRYRFDAIVHALGFTNKTPPTYRDRFWEVRDMLAAWNKNMADNFCPSWISCLDESMSKWVNKFTYPGYMCVPRKPWQFGNEYHTICCSKSGIMYAMELVEGRDTPPQRPAKKFSELGKTVGLMLRLTHCLHSSSKAVVLDSGFCVLKGLQSSGRRKFLLQP